MSTIPTQNPVPSEAPRDLKYNSGKVDEFVTSNNHFYTDRFGKNHYTIDGINYLSKQAMLNYGYITKRSFESGNTIINPNDVLLWESNGEYYRWDGELPKVVSADSTPESAGGIGEGKWKSIGDATLRSELSSNEGLSLIGESSGINAQEAIDNIKERYLLGYQNHPHINIPTLIASTPAMETSELIFGKNNSLNELIELIVKPNKVDDIDVYIHGDLASKVNTSQAATHVVYGGCDKLDRSGYINIPSGADIINQSDDKLHVRLDISSLTKDYLAFSYRNQPNST
ncbi:TPA: hypothetical protein ACKRLX_001371, partial [Proteus mirabilis]